MINTIKNLYYDFIEFRRIRNLCNITKLWSQHKILIRSYDKEKEIDLNSLIIGSLSSEMLSWKLSPDYVNGFRSALVWRISILWQVNHKFPLSK